MRPHPDPVVEPFRVQSHPGYRSDPGAPWGAFYRQSMSIISSGPPVPGAPPWEHVSVSFKHRDPTWAEMTQVKDWFFDPEETVVQFHPARAEYVNLHLHCLHLWRSLDTAFPMPPVQCV